MQEATKEVVKRWSMVVSGRVQGVGYRYFAKDAADALGVSGFAQNHFDGTVEIEAQGEELSLEQFCDQLRDGPPLAHVADLRRCEIPLDQAESSFEAR